VEKDGVDTKDDKDKKEKEPEFEMLQNPSRVIKPQVNILGLDSYFF